MNYFEKPYTAEHLRKQYRDLVKVHHPDVGGKHQVFIQIQNEYELLMSLNMSTNDQSENLPETQKEAVNFFDWDIEQRNIYNIDGSLIQGYKSIYNNQTNEVLNVCKSTYTPTTNELFSDFVAYLNREVEAKTLNFSTFDGGKKVLAFLETPEQLVANHKYKRFLLVGNSHDSSSAFFVGTTSVMIRCANQFTAKNQQLKAWHTASNARQLESIKFILKHHNELNSSLNKNLESFALRSVSPDEKNAFIRHALGLPQSIDIRELSTRMKNKLDNLNDCIIKEVADLGRNAHALFEGATRYTSHEMKSRQASFGSVFGTPSEVNKRAYEYCQELIR